MLFSIAKRYFHYVGWEIGEVFAGMIWAIARHGFLPENLAVVKNTVGASGRHPCRYGCVNLACEDWLVVRLANRFESHFWID